MLNLPVSGVDALWGDDIGNPFRRHLHTTYIIGKVTRGKRIITHSDGVAAIWKNEVFIINPGQVHACRSDSQTGHSYKILSIAPDTMQSLAAQAIEFHAERPYFKGILNKDLALSEKLSKLFDAIEATESDDKIEAKFFSFLAYLRLNFSEYPPLSSLPGDQNGSIKRVCEYIHHNPADDLSLKKLADIACLSPFHFQREFKKALGVTPHEYLSDCRIRVSRRILARSEKIADIAVQLGFFDQSHFSRVFRKTVGVAPGHYRKSNPKP